MKTILLIDGNAIAHANHRANKLTVGGMEVQAIFGMLKSVGAMLRDTPGDATPIILWDGKAQFRYDLFPEYKGNRKAKTPEEEADKAAFKRQSPFIEKAFQLLGVRQYRSPAHEADDLAAMYVAKLAPTHRIRLVTGDKDWLQLMRPGVSWHDPINQRECSAEKLFEFTGFRTPAAFVQGKALTGDGSDNVPGIHKLGDKTAQEMLALWGDINRFFAAVDDGSHTPARRKSATATSKHPEELLASPEGRALFARNLALMDLSRAPLPAPGELLPIEPSPSAERFRMLCQRLAFASILRTEAQFLAPFKLTPA